MEPSTLRLLVLLALGGALGTIARYFVSAAFEGSGSFPWGTFAVNFTGSVLLAWLMFGAVAQGIVGPETRITLGIAFLGAYTTMSTFSFESVAMLEAGQHGQAALNFLVNPVLCIGGAWMGRLLALGVPGGTGI